MESYIEVRIECTQSKSEPLVRKEEELKELVLRKEEELATFFLIQLQY